MHFFLSAAGKWLAVALLVASIAQSSDILAQPLDLSRIRTQGKPPASSGEPLPETRPIVATDQSAAMPARTRPQRRANGEPLALSGSPTSSQRARARPKQSAAGRSGSKPQPGNAPATARDRRIVGFGLETLPGKPELTPQQFTPAGKIATAQHAPAKPASPAQNSPAPTAPRPAAAPAQIPAKCDLNEAMKARVESLVTRFCTNNAAALERAKLAWQHSELELFGKKIQAAGEDLEKKLKEFKKVRDEIAEMRKKQSEQVVDIFSQMRPDAAAQQLSSMKHADAASILTAMQPKIASLILNEMPPKQAALLSGSMLANRNGELPSAIPAQN